MTDMSEMFASCSVLQELDLSSFDTSNVTNISGLFEGCRSLQKLNLSGLKMSHITDMSYFFSGCSVLRELDLSGADTSHVENMRGMFISCYSLQELDLSGIDTSHVTDMGGMFNGCKSLQELDLRHFDTGSVTDMGGMFGGCESLVELDLSSFDTSGVVKMGATTSLGRSGMFQGCKKLERLDLSSFDTSNVSQMDAMFDGCESLKELDLSNFSMANIGRYTNPEFGTCCEDFLQDCNSLETIYTPCGVRYDVSLPKAKDSDVWRGIIDGEQTELTTLPKGLTESSLLVKNKTQVQVEENIRVKKGKTIYACGEALSVDDLKVTYYGAEGSIRTLSAGEYTTNAADIDMRMPGEQTLTVTYAGVSGTLTAEVKLRAFRELTAENVTITMPEGYDYVYTGAPVTPEPTLVWKGYGDEVTLQREKDYTLSYQDNINAGKSTTMVIVTGAGDYKGKSLISFRINKAAAPVAEEMACNLLDCSSAVADRKLDLAGSFAGYGKKAGYHILSVAEDDAIAGAVFAKTPVDADISDSGVFTYSTNAGKSGDFATVRLRVAFDNYEDAELTVKIVFTEERVMYTVTYDMMGHGGSGRTVSVKAGSLLTEPQLPEETGYLFTGWYADRNLEKQWDFAADTVQADTTLYAGWLSDRSDGKLQMYIQDIRDLTYTGSAIKPTVVVYDSDGRTLLKAGKDYTVKYYNNVNAGGAEASGAVAKVVSISKNSREILHIVPGTGGQNFTLDAPYIAITGKGNYSETVYKNFCILPADIGTADAAPAQGFTLKYNDQLATNARAEQKPFSSIRYKKAMKTGTDISVSLLAADVVDAAGQAVPADWKAEGSQANRWNPAIPKGYSGTFLLTIAGRGNYTGEIRRTVFVNSKEKLIKNVSVTLGRNQKNRPYTGRAVTLTDFLVKMGRTALANGKDYEVSYKNNVAVGTATMTITGKNGYVGTKSVTFKITGEKFTAGSITVRAYDKEHPDDNDFKASMPYTGSAVLQNKVTLTTKATKAKPNPKQLVYGTHYTIGYKNNVKKGTATMIFTAKPESGYSGSFKKTFRITAQPLSRENLTVQKAAGSAKVQMPYRKNGAVPSFVLTNAAGAVLAQGRDYTVRGKNNMAVTTAQTPENKTPVMVITGRGNYTGTLEVPFEITRESLESVIESGVVQISCTSAKKKAGMKFQDLRFKLTEGRKTLALGETKDYTLEQKDCTPERLLAYAEALENGTASNLEEPSVTVRGTGVNYTGTVTVPLGRYLYVEKLTNSNLYVVVSEGKDQTIYTGTQLKPTAAVYYGDAKAVSAAKRAKEKDAAALTAADGSYRLVRLAENADYTLDYGANTAAGKNRGSVKVTGAGKYGGSVTVKFTIERKSVCTAAFTLPFKNG